jgi:cytochrome oxidase Cu insertion factor (SCO1/SenC/PrrC family)
MRKYVLCAALALSVAGLAPAAERRATPVAVGETAPDFSLKDQNGETVKLSASQGQRPAVLVFYRGYW